MTGQTIERMDIFEFRDGNGDIQQIMPPITHHLAAGAEARNLQLLLRIVGSIHRTWRLARRKQKAQD